MRIYVLLPRFPYPLEKGDKLRAFHQIRVLSQQHEIHLCAFNEGPVETAQIEALKPYCGSIMVVPFSKIERFANLVRGVFSSLPLQVAYFHNVRLAALVREHIRTIGPDVVYCQLTRTAEVLRGLSGFPRVIDYQDAFAKGAERLMRHGPLLQRPIFAVEYTRLAKYEQLVFDEFERHTVISAQDRDLLCILQREKVAVVPNGVDTDYFAPIQQQKDTDLIFTGNMGYPPNVRAAEVLVKEVLPILRKSKKDINLILAGARPTVQVKALAGNGVEVTGFVPDLRQQYARARICLAPMQIGTGLQNKILESMSMAIPCITTTLANNAIGAAPGHQAIIADTPEAMAQAALDLLNDEPRAHAVAQAGRAFVLNRFSWQAATAPLQQLLAEAAQQSGK